MDKNFNKQFRKVLVDLKLSKIFILFFAMNLASLLLCSQLRAVDVSTCTLEKVLSCENLKSLPPLIDTGNGTYVENQGSSGSLISNASYRDDADIPQNSAKAFEKIKDELDLIDLEFSALLNPKTVKQIDEKTFRDLTIYSHAILEASLPFLEIKDSVRGEVPVVSQSIDKQLVRMPASDGSRNVSKSGFSTAVLEMLALLGPEQAKKFKALAQRYADLKKKASVLNRKALVPWSREFTAEEKQKNNNRVIKVFAETKESLKKVFTQQWGNGPYTAVQEAIFLKIDKVAINFNPLCEDETNATYSNDVHRVSVCSGLSALPNESLTFILAHEIAHSFDSCRSRGTLFIVDIDALKKLRLSGEAPDVLRNNSLFKSLPAAPYSNIVVGYDYGSLATKSVIDSKIISFIGSPTTSQDDPFAYLNQCLIKSVGLNEMSIYAQGELLERYRRVQGLADNKLSDEATAALKSGMKELSSCFEKGQDAESFADAIAAKTLALSLKKDGKPTSQNDKIKAFGLFAGLACYEKFVAETGKLPESLANIQKGVEGLGEIEFTLNSVSARQVGMKNDYHALFKERLELILFQEPEIRKFLGCSNKPDSRCLVDINKGSLPSVGDQGNNPSNNQSNGQSDLKGSEQ